MTKERVTPMVFCEHRIMDRLAVAVMLAGSSCTIASADDPEIYWTTVFGNAIKRSAVECPAPVTVISDTNVVTGIALDQVSRMIYWNGVQPQGIYRAAFDGSGVVEIVGGCGPSGLCSYSGLALDLGAGKIYWTGSGISSEFYMLRRANLDGTEIEDVIAPEKLTRPGGLALDVKAGKVYWGEGALEKAPGKIRRANLDGSEIEELANVGVNTATLALDVMGDKMYWTSNGEGEVWRANLNGTNKELLVDQLVNPLGLVLDLNAGKVYWADHIVGKIQRANLDGSGVEDVLSSGPSSVEGLALKHSFCPGDTNNDNRIDPIDLIDLLGAWGGCFECPQDLDCDEDVDEIDLELLIGAWGACER